MESGSKPDSQSDSSKKSELKPDTASKESEAEPDPEKVTSKGDESTSKEGEITSKGEDVDPENVVSVPNELDSKIQKAKQQVNLFAEQYARAAKEHTDAVLANITDPDRVGSEEVTIKNNIMTAVLDQLQTSRLSLASLMTAKTGAEASSQYIKCAPHVLATIMGTYMPWLTRKDAHEVQCNPTVTSTTTVTWTCPICPLNPEVELTPIECPEMECPASVEYAWEHVAFTIGVMLTITTIKVFMQISGWRITSVVDLKGIRLYRACEDQLCYQGNNPRDADFIYILPTGVYPTCARCLMSVQAFPNQGQLDKMVGIVGFKVNLCSICGFKTPYVCAECHEPLCFSIFDTDDDTKCHTVHTLKCKDENPLRYIPVRILLYGIIVCRYFNAYIQGSRLKLLDVGDFLRSQAWTMIYRLGRSIAEGITSSTALIVVEFLQATLEILTLAGDSGLGPTSIARGVSVLTYLLKGPAMCIMSISLFLVVLLKATEPTVPNPVTVTPKRTIQRRLQNYSPLGMSPHLERNDNMDNSFTVQRVKAVMIFIVLITIAFTIQACQPATVDQTVEDMENDGIKIIVSLELLTALIIITGTTIVLVTRACLSRNQGEIAMPPPPEARQLNAQPQPPQGNANIPGPNDRPWSMVAGYIQCPLRCECLFFTHGLTPERTGHNLQHVWLARCANRCTQNVTHTQNAGLIIPPADEGNIVPIHKCHVHLRELNEQVDPHQGGDVKRVLPTSPGVPERRMTPDAKAIVAGAEQLREWTLRLSHMRVPALKQVLRQYQEPTTGLKGDLVRRLGRHYYLSGFKARVDTAIQNEA